MHGWQHKVLSKTCNLSNPESLGVAAHLPPVRMSYISPISRSDVQIASIVYINFTYKLYCWENDGVFFISYTFSIVSTVHPSNRIEGKCSKHLLWQNVLQRCRGGWLLWRQPEEDLLNDVNRKVPLRTPPLSLKLAEHRRFTTHFSHRDLPFQTRDCLAWTVKCYYFRFAGLTLRVERIRRTEKKNDLLTQGWITVALTKRIPVPDRCFGPWMFSLAALAW